MRCRHFKTALAVNILAYGCIAAMDSRACTTFALSESDEKAIGKSYDWPHDHAVAYVNKANMRKTALTVFDANTPATWTSRYGSVTFSQFAQELPLGGMNEAGLVVEIMWLSPTHYPSGGSLPSINELQWIQYILDLAATAGEAVDLAGSVRIAGVIAPVHYMACDRSGDCAVFEYLDRELVIHHGPSMPVKTLTNDTYQSLFSSLGNYRGFGGEKEIPLYSQSSQARFVRASALAAGYVETREAFAAKNAVFEILESVENELTQWQIAYEPNTARITFHHLHSHATMEFHLQTLDFSCIHPVQVMDLSGDLGGGTGRFRKNTAKLNRRALDLADSMLENELPEELLQKTAAYPETLECLE